MSARLVNGQGGLFKRARLICHVLLLETEDGLVLVDTGLGLGDIAKPERLGKDWLRNVSPRLAADETAVEQVKALGFSAALHRSEITIFSSHDPHEYDCCCGQTELGV